MFKKTITTMFTVSFLTFAVLSVCAIGEPISFVGTIVPQYESIIMSEQKGVVRNINYEAGQYIQTGNVLLTLETDKVYSPVAGKVVAINAEAGDSTDIVTKRFGAIINIEDEFEYEVKTNSENAYNSVDAKLIHVGEEVFISCTADNKHTGTGTIVSLENGEYTIKIKNGSFIVGESVNVYKGSQSVASKRIGRGDIKRSNPISIPISGNISTIAVTVGDMVRKGDLLCETIDTGISGFLSTPAQIVSDYTGIIGKLNVTTGSSITNKEPIAIIYPTDKVRVSGYVSEYAIHSLVTGQNVIVEMLSKQDCGKQYPGTITLVSTVSETRDSQKSNISEESSAQYKVYADFECEDSIFFGMSAIVSVAEESDTMEIDEDN